MKTYNGWKQAVRARAAVLCEELALSPPLGTIIYTGNKDINNAFLLAPGEKFWLGEWDGCEGEVSEGNADGCAVKRTAWC